jgi:hypothetical protein
MRVLALALTDPSRRFTRGFPAKGARLLLTPNLEVARLATLAADTDEFDYLDERTSLLEWTQTPDLMLAYAGLEAEESARRLAGRLEAGGPDVVFFGPAFTVARDSDLAWARHRVVGDVTDVWPALRGDAATGCLRPVYFAPRQPGYVMPRPHLTAGPDMNSRHQTISFVRGCSCPDSLSGLCSEYLYYGRRTLRRSADEIVGEIVALPGKHIALLDEDVTRYPDYYYRVFRRIWDYRRHWTVRASDRLFEHPKLVHALAKAGTKIVFLNETFLSDRLESALADARLVRQLYHRVKYLQASRMLVGARLTLDLTSGLAPDYERIASLVRRLALDFTEVRLVTAGRTRLATPHYRPMLDRSDPAWVVARFYSIGAIAERLARRPRRVGFHSTLFYLLPRSVAYRQNFFEGIPGD